MTDRQQEHMTEKLGAEGITVCTCVLKASVMSDSL